ncbi:MAG: helix-turn-helix transcriptional regulator [Planctomycetes bacterium]|nr:helix-turn-helix transcriptional regulator [Planctomycetota bacterium]
MKTTPIAEPLGVPPVRRLVFKDFSLTMAKAVADFCRELNISVDDLAQRSGLEEGRVTAIALGRWTPSPVERQKIAEVFAVAIDEIAWGHKTPIQHLYGHGPG